MELFQPWVFKRRSSQGLISWLLTWSPWEKNSAYKRSETFIALSQGLVWSDRSEVVMNNESNNSRCILLSPSTPSKISRLDELMYIIPRYANNFSLDTTGKVTITASSCRLLLTNCWVCLTLSGTLKISCKWKVSMGTHSPFIRFLTLNFLHIHITERSIN